MSDINFAFPCSSCGACCRRVGAITAGKALDRGDGICMHLDTDTNLCTIYETRSDICRVDRQYILNYADQMNWAGFVALNISACEMMQKLDLINLN